MQKRFSCLFVVALTVLLSSVSAEPITFQTEWSQAPQTWPVVGYEAVETRYPGVKAVYFAGPAYQGKATRVFAYYGIPALPPGEKASGMVLVHGGGGTAFSEWVALWREKGYAAIAMDCNGSRPIHDEQGKLLPGEKHERHEWGGPGGWGGFDQMDAPLEDHWVYQSAANIALAHSLLQSFPEVDPDRIGLTGISWGGFLTCISAGLDNRYACAAPVYGCGGITKESCWQEGFDNMPSQQVTRWNASYDPLVYLPNAGMPMLWVNGTNDFAYWMENWQQSYRTSPAKRTLCMRVNMPHSHPAGWAPQEIAAYMDHHLRNSMPLIQITDQGREGSKVWVTYSQDVPVKAAQLHYCDDLSSTPPERVWKSIDANVDNPRCKVIASLPDAAKMYFLTLVSPKDLLVSTEHVLIFDKSITNDIQYDESRTKGEDLDKAVRKALEREYYRHLKHKIGEESLPALYTLIENDSSSSIRARAATAIGYFGRNQQSTQVLMKFITSPIIADEMSDLDFFQTIGGKCAAIRMLGLTGEKDTIELLESIVSSKQTTGQFLSAWINGPIHEWHGGKQLVLANARGNAAQGLIFSQDKDKIVFVEQYYESIDATLKEFDEASIEKMDEVEREKVRHLISLHHELQRALIYSAYINDNGVAAYLEMGRKSPELQRIEMGKYYNLFIQPLE